MQWYTKSILNRILTVVSLANLLIAAMAAMYFNSSLKVQEQYDHLVSAQMVQAIQAQDILSDFKTQVQEWKNVLLRGTDPAQREKYWNRFQSTEANIQHQLDQFI